MVTYQPSRYERLEEKVSRAKKTLRRKADSNIATRAFARGFCFVGKCLHFAVRFAINNVALTIVYFGGVGISFVIMKVLNKDIGFSNSEGSSWVDFEQKNDKKSYLKQF